VWDGAEAAKVAARAARVWVVMREAASGCSQCWGAFFSHRLVWRSPEKLKKLQDGVRTGGKGTQRRKKKVVRSGGGGDGKKVAETLKRAGVQSLPGCEEANLFREDGTVIHFVNPKVQANVNANTYYISGKPEEKKASEIGNDFASAFASMGGAGGGDDDVPDLVPSFDK
jgi:nascent polypeptide-associated complex subunit beta